MRTIELNDEFVDQIVITELKDIFLRNINSEDVDDMNVANAAAKLLKYVMVYKEAISWIDSNTK